MVVLPYALFFYAFNGSWPNYSPFTTHLINYLPTTHQPLKQLPYNIIGGKSFGFGVVAAYYAVT